jgi:LysM repeat protein
MNKHLSRAFVFALAVSFIGIGLNSGNAQTHAPRHTRRTKSSSTEPANKTIRARAGDSLSSIAERTGASLDDLAQLNNLSQKSKLRKGQRIIVPAAAVAQPQEKRPDGLPNGQLIKFADGGTLHVDTAWWHGEEVWYSRGGITETSRRKVKSIEPVFVAAVETKNPRTPPVIVDSENAAKLAAATWIYLVGGARFKVDGVNKTADGAWYQRGSLVSFLETARIERIERELPGNHLPVWKDQDWTSGNPIIDQAIRTNGARFGVDPYLVFLVIEQESHFRTKALSPKGAQGLMQLMPGTARRFGVRRTYDPLENIRGGTQYLKELLTMFKGRVDLALASYNAGEGRVISYGNKVPPFQETQNYVRRINQRYKKGSSYKKDAAKAPADDGIRVTVNEERP